MTSALNESGVKQPDAISRSAPLKHKLYNEMPIMTVKEAPVQMTINAVPIKAEPLHSKYLHKKFKKVASPLLNEDNNVINGNHFLMTTPEASPGGRYVCSYCNLVCAKPSVLQKHIRAHTNERPYPCEPCGFAFKTKSNLYKHCRSRTHVSKLEETGEKMPYFDGDEPMSSEDDDNSSNVSNSRTDNDSESKEEARKTIYKPKYRFMESSKLIINEKSEDRKENSCSPTSRLKLKIPVPNSTPSVSTPSPFSVNSSPSPEFLHRHINKLISENQAIVETNDPFWAKRFLHRTNSCENTSSLSPSSSCPSPGDSKSTKQSPTHSSPSDLTENLNCEKSPQKQSKLALALLRPQSSVLIPPAMEVCDIQPLNLSTSNKECIPQQNRKRSYSEGFPEKFPKLIKEKSMAVPFKLNNSIQDFRRFNSDQSDNFTAERYRKEVMGSMHITEGSIIKDLLLKVRENTSGASSADAKNAKVLLTQSPERPYSPSSQYMCQLCKDPEGFESVEHLEMHQVYHCRASDTFLRSSLYRSPLRDHMEANSPSYHIPQGPLLIAPSHPSPGPLLGSTPLVDSYHKKSMVASEINPLILKKRRFDTSANETRVISGTTLRSLEELSKCPMRSNLQLFGGEVKILDSTGGETKMRIDPSTSRSPKPPSESKLQHSGASKEGSPLKGTAINVVVTTNQELYPNESMLVEVPNKIKDSGQLSLRLGAVFKSTRTSSPNSPFMDNKSVLIPAVSQVVVPSTPRISSTSSEHSLKPFSSIFSDTPVINPLTSITAYNPLTLPPAPHLPPTSAALGITSPYSTGGIITIFHGGKEIPYVPGMPGPHTFFHNPEPISPTDKNQTVLAEPKLNNPVEPNVRNAKPERLTLSVINKPSSLKIPAIQVNSETLVSPVDGSSSPNLRKRSVDESLSSPAKRSQGFALLPDTESISEVPSVEKRFLRPSSLPLKPGTFVPKRHQLTPVLSLVSPETPRPRKSYGQLYLNGHAYTYLGLKCSTRMFFCTLNKPQPLYVPLSPEHNKVSMYSNWKVRTESDPNPCGLDPGSAMALYDSRHRPLTYTMAKSRDTLVVTHSSYWMSRHGTAYPNKDESSPDDESTPDSAPKRLKTCVGGYESDEKYPYIRGRGRGRYVCEECGIRCKKPSMLKKHIRTHTDVRPYTCVHCKFSFKTKGNLTKHMKSKAHYKKCTDLNIVPVPTAVDDSYVDEEVLAQQQALREKQGGNQEESEEEYEDEEESEEDDDDEDEAEGENCLEREAARSLITLSETFTQHLHAREGLVPLRVRPNTYPYSLTQALARPSSPAQPDKDKEQQLRAEDVLKERREDDGKFRTSPHYFLTNDSGDSATESSARVKQPTPMDLSNKSTDKSPRVCEAAILLASLCSTMERLPAVSPVIVPASDNSALLQAYLTEKAVQDTRIKQHQFRQKPIVTVMDQRVKPTGKPTSVNIAAAKENALGILAQTSSDARKVSTPEQQPSMSKPQAEFLPPSSGPSPSYVSVLEDGRSLCNMCNKVFSKPSQLRLHVNIHYFERPFRCDSCAVSFRTKGHLQKHQRSVSHVNKANMNSTFGTATTTNPRPFKCDDCKIAFRIHGHLAKHLRSKMHIMKLECLGKLPFGTYAELERSGMNMNDIDTTDCENSLESLQLLAQKLYEKDPTNLGQWNPSEMMPQHGLSPGESSSGEEDEDTPCTLPAAPTLSPVQRLPPPPIQKAGFSQSNVEPLKCSISVNNSPSRHEGDSSVSENERRIRTVEPAGDSV